MRYLIILFFTFQLFAVDASLKIEKDVESRARISLVDGSGAPPAISEKFFSTMLSDLKISGHFLPDAAHHRAGYESGTIAPTLKSRDYVLKYRLIGSAGLRANIKLYRTSDATLIASKDYAIGSAAKYPF
ncbi:MAG: translocation protein TolB, partial [Campylobacteraceae bacterium 4484_4]